MVEATTYLRINRSIHCHVLPILAAEDRCPIILRTDQSIQSHHPPPVTVPEDRCPSAVLLLPDQSTQSHHPPHLEEDRCPIQAIIIITIVRIGCYLRFLVALELTTSTATTTTTTLEEEESFQQDLPHHSTIIEIILAAAELQLLHPRRYHRLLSHL